MSGTGMGWRGLVAKCGVFALRATLYVSPWPMVLLLRKQFVDNGKRFGAALMEQAPADVCASIDEPYGPDVDERYDVYWPGSVAARAGERLPTVVWIHGGAFIGGSKEEIGGYLRLLAGAGFTVVGVRYSLAPGARYPTPARQVMAALRHLQADADRLHVDPDRLVLAGDSAGAHVSAQVAAIATNPDYARQMGITSTVRGDQLRGVVLCCGVFDLTRIRRDSPLRDFIAAVGWAYAGRRDFRDDRWFASTTTVADHVTAAFPRTFLTAGNADPLEPQSKALADALVATGVHVDTLFYLPDHQPALPHEYQWEPDLEDARIATDRIVDFVRSCTADVGAREDPLG